MKLSKFPKSVQIELTLEHIMTTTRLPAGKLRETMTPVAPPIPTPLHNDYICALFTFFLSYYGDRITWGTPSCIGCCHSDGVATVLLHFFAYIYIVSRVVLSEISLRTALVSIVQQYIPDVAALFLQCKSTHWAAHCSYMSALILFSTVNGHLFWLPGAYQSPKSTPAAIFQHVLRSQWHCTLSLPSIASPTAVRST